MTQPAAPSTLPATYAEAGALLARHSGPRALLLLLLVLAGTRLWLAPWTLPDTLLVLALPLLRGPVEWVLHRYVWHARPLPLCGIALPNAVTRLHREHHRNPHDPETLLFGWRNLLLATLSLLALAGLLLPVAQALSAVLSVLLLIAIYEWFHLIAHSRIQPRARWFRHIIANHRHHHFRDENACLGVSSTLGDRLLGTLPPDRDA